MPLAWPATFEVPSVRAEGTFWTTISGGFFDGDPPGSLPVCTESCDNDDVVAVAVGEAVAGIFKSCAG